MYQILFLFVHARYTIHDSSLFMLLLCYLTLGARDKALKAVHQKKADISSHQQTLTSLCLYRTAQDPIGLSPASLGEAEALATTQARVPQYGAISSHIPRRGQDVQMSLCPCCPAVKAVSKHDLERGEQDPQRHDLFMTYHERRRRVACAILLDRTSRPTDALPSLKQSLGLPGSPPVRQN